tara:strand:- start:2938 stop:3114 length:177 start_codon:yes stop_codon:yes gene_type:complete
LVTGSRFDPKISDILKSVKKRGVQNITSKINTAEIVMTAEIEAGAEITPPRYLRQNPV